MKNLFFLLVAVVGVELIKGMTEEDAISAMGPFIEKCDPTPSKQDIVDILRNTEQVERSAKCFRLCLMKQMEMLKDRKLDVEKMQDIVSMLYEGKEDDTAEIVKGCNDNVKTDDECNAAHGYGMCMLKGLDAKGMKLPELEKSD